MLIIGLVTKATISVTYLGKVYYSSTSVLGSDVMDFIKNNNALHLIDPKIYPNHYSENLFGVNAMIKNILDLFKQYKIDDPIYQSLNDFYTTILNLSNTAIAGFSFIMISILTFGGFGVMLLIKR